jgi:hypothetical protein
VGKRCGEKKATQTEDEKLIIRKHHRGREEKDLVASHGYFKHFNSDLRNSTLCSWFWGHCISACQERYKIRVVLLEKFKITRYSKIVVSVSVSNQDCCHGPFKGLTRTSITIRCMYRCVLITMDSGPERQTYMYVCMFWWQNHKLSFSVYRSDTDTDRIWFILQDA